MSVEESQDQLLLHKKRKLSSFTMDDVPSQALSSNDVDKILGNLDNLNSIADIEGIQKKLQGDYKLLAKQFGNSRLARVDAFLNNIEKLQSSLRKQSDDYEDFVNNNLPLLDDDTSAESISAAEHKSNKRRRNASQTELIKRASSPPPECPLSPPLEQLPIFTESFEQILKPYRSKLQSLRHKYDYESDLIENSARSNVELVWRQSIKDRMDLRKTARSEKTKELLTLEKDYFNDDKYTKLSHLDKRYRISTKKVGERKHPRYATNEQIRDVDQRVRRFNTYFSAHKKPVFPAYDNEIDYDLDLMKARIQVPVKLEKIEVNYLYEEQPLKKESIGPTTMTDLVNSEIEERGVAGIKFPFPNDPRYQQQQQHPHPHPPPPQQQQHQPQPQQIQQHHSQSPNPTQTASNTPSGGQKHLQPKVQPPFENQNNPPMYVGYPNLTPQQQQQQQSQQQSPPQHHQPQPQQIPAPQQIPQSISSQSQTPQIPQQFIPQQQQIYQHPGHPQAYIQQQYGQQQQPSTYLPQAQYQYQPALPPGYYNPQMTPAYYAGNIPYGQYPVYATPPYPQAQQQPQQ